MNMAEDHHYTKYKSYIPYAKYDPYSTAVEEAAAKMQHAKRNMMAAEQMMHEASEAMMAEENMKRHMMGTSEVAQPEGEGMMMTGDAVEKREVPENKLLPDNWYGHYE
jgi:hypothetical protein